jgi:hypothetical protein
VPAANEPDASKRESFRGDQVDTERAQRSSAVGHESLTAGLINGRPVAVSDDDAQSFSARSDCGGQPGGPAANYENVSLQNSPAQ